MQRLIKLTYILLFPLVAFCQVNKNYTKALDLYINDKPDKAEKFILKALKQDKGNEEYMSLCSKIYFAQKKYEQSKLILDLGITSNPKSVFLLNNRGYLSYLLGEHEDAIKLYSSALRHVSDDSLKCDLYCSRASSKLAIRKFESAKTDLEKSLKIDSNGFCANNNMGLVAADLGSDSIAEYHLLKILRIMPDDFVGFANLGYFYSERERYSEALTMLNKSLEMSPEFSYGYNNRGYVKLKTGDLEGARTDVLKSLEINPYNSYAYRNLGLIMLEFGDNEKACQAWNTAIKLEFTRYYGSDVQKLLDQHCEQ